MGLLGKTKTGRPAADRLVAHEQLPDQARAGVLDRQQHRALVDPHIVVTDETLVQIERVDEPVAALGRISPYQRSPKISNIRSVVFLIADSVCSSPSSLLFQ